MAQRTTIEWTEATWNPVIGCTKVSDGCFHCYAERMANRLAAMARADRRAGRNPGRKAAYCSVVDGNGYWNGQVYLDEGALDDPLRWRQSRMVFVDSMGDLFHEAVPLEFIRRVFAVMNDCEQHTFQILTKRPERAMRFSAELLWTPNIWMGATVENAELASPRARCVRSTGARVKFLSVEPLLGPIPRLPLTGIDWIIVGGESGPGARPMLPEWVRQIRDRCMSQGVPFFFKQWGGVDKKANGRTLDGRTWDEMPLAHGTGR
ncbi:MAG: phage Gp37/Gp68 family protein [Phycisphaerae bacterium]